MRVLGFGLSFLKGRSGATAPAATGGLGAILLLALKSTVEGDVLNKSGGVIQVNYEVGFYLVLLLFLAAVAVNIFVLLQGKGPPVPALEAGERSRFCTQCGSKNPSTNSFCEECGVKLA